MVQSWADHLDVLREGGEVVPGDLATILRGLQRQEP